MKKLSKTWLTDPHIDAEYKSYVLLDYLQKIQQALENMKLFPALPELTEHYQELQRLKSSSNLYRELFPKQLVGVNWQEKKLAYEYLVKDISLMEEILKTLEFSIPLLKEQIDIGNEIYNSIETQIQISSVGLMPLKTDEGYLLVNTGPKVLVYQYQITLFEHSQTKYRGLHTSYIKNYPWTLSTTFATIKQDLVRQNSTLPNPATFAFETAKKLPLQECYLPIVRRMLLQQLYEYN